MKLTVLIAGVAGACLLCGPMAQAQGQPNNCLVLGNGAPRMFTGMATSSNQTSAQNSAQSSWSQQTLPFGGQYQSWSKAANKSTSCTSSKPNFSYVYTCRATAQPCK